jgi:hypothetical protein
LPALVSRLSSLSLFSVFWCLCLVSLVSGVSCLVYGVCFLCVFFASARWQVGVGALAETQIRCASWRSSAPV